MYRVGTLIRKHNSSHIAHEMVTILPHILIRAVIYYNVHSIVLAALINHKILI